MLRPSSLLIVALLASGCARTQLRFTITAPESTPADARVVIISDDDWAFGDGLVLARDGNVWTGEISVGAPAEISYEIRLRNPDRAEVTEAWEPVAPRVVQVAEEPAEQAVEANVGRWDEPPPPGKVSLTFEVTVPANSGSRLWITGEGAGLGEWRVRSLRAYRDAENRFVTRAFVDPNATYRYAVTRGHWGAVERTATNGPLAERSVTVGAGDHREAITVARWMGSREENLTGSFRLHQDVASAHVRARPVLVWLPPGYEDEGNTARYPVLYLHDGQNVFNGRTSFLGEWHADETAQRLVELGQIEPVILVAAYNTQDRIPEYTQVPMAQYAGSGNADAYGAFLVEELKPFIDATYRTRTDAASTGVAGSSLGGLVSLYFGLKHPDVFSRLGVISPSVWWADRDIVGQVEALPARLPLRIWVDIGTQEGGSPQQTVADTRLLRDTLIAEGWVLGQDLGYLEAAGAAHNEEAWAARFDEVLRFLYPAP